MSPIDVKAPAPVFLRDESWLLMRQMLIERIALSSEWQAIGFDSGLVVHVPEVPRDE
ncbi:hypothetical protein JWH16_04625 [Xanthomonas campestris pv. campestris]|uniref:hypothetical protein n=1 Tax=Xanthomonas campestris TaxID=339 RepID=UPI001E658CA2|nr:hypothetical protein [Xanthomonas campestris]MCD0253140.1 hypothetical protein [Xanthomonas campestris pv. campestris]